MTNRKTIPNNTKTLLYREVNGYCPLCGDTLIYEKNNTFRYKCEVAHIYPLNPKKEELITLKGVEKLHHDIDNIKNLVCLCRDCHKKFDNPRTLKEYRNLIKIKKELLKEIEIKDDFYSYQIENDIKKILLLLSNEENDNDNKLEYNPKTIDDKTNETIKVLTKNKIKYHVTEYFFIIKKEFQNIDSLQPNKASLIATQVKSFYFKALEKDNSQEFIYNTLVEWLDSKTNISKEASAIVISYFIQNCEVFDVVSK